MSPINRALYDVFASREYPPGSRSPSEREMLKMKRITMPGFTALNAIGVGRGSYYSTFVAGPLRSSSAVRPAAGVSTFPGGGLGLGFYDPCEVTCHFETVYVCNDPCAD